MALATELVAAGDHAQAMPQLREAVPDFPDARVRPRHRAGACGRTDEGIAVLRQFIPARPAHLNRIPARTLLAQAMGSQNIVEAAGELRAIMQMAPDSEGVRTLLADMLFAAGKADESAAEYRLLVASRPDDSSLQSKLAATLLTAGRLAEATEHFQKALQLDPRSAVLNRSLAEVYVRQDDPARAEPYAREALRLEPGNPAAHNVLGITLASNGRLDEAIAQFRRRCSSPRRCAGPGQSRARAAFTAKRKMTAARWRSSTRQPGACLCLCPLPSPCPLPAFTSTSPRRLRSGESDPR